MYEECSNDSFKWSEDILYNNTSLEFSEYSWLCWNHGNFDDDDLHLNSILLFTSYL